jgi:hypothetical protein
MDPCVFRYWAYETGPGSNVTDLGIPSFFFNGDEQIKTADLTFFDQTRASYSFARNTDLLEIFLTWKDEDTITVNLPNDPISKDKGVNAGVWIVRYKDMDVQKVESGVNAGRVLRFSNIIQDTRHIAKWRGQERTIDVDVEKPKGGKERGGHVILVQEFMGSPILAAGRLADYPMPNDIKPKSVKPKVAAPPVAETPAPAVLPKP